MRASLSLVGLLVAVTNATPLDVRAPSDCATVSSAATKSLAACKSYKPYCSSVAPASAVTSTVTQTSTKRTTTKVSGTQTITVTGTSSAISDTTQGAVFPAETTTVTETATPRCTPAVPASNLKRATASFGPCLSSFEAKWASAVRTAACKCLQTTPTSKVTVKTAVTSTVTNYQETTTVTVNSVAKTTPISTITMAPPNPATVTVTTTSYSTIERTSSALANPTSIPAPKSGNSWNWWYVESPWPITLFGESNTTLLVSTNGFISLGHGHGGGYGNQHLPTGGKEYWDFQLPDVTFATYWTGQDVNTNYYWPPQDLAYEVIGEAPNRILSFEHRGLENGAFRHYMTSFFEAQPGKAEFYYIDIPTPREAQGNNYVHSTVGVQRYATGQFSEWAFNDYTRIYNGLKLTWDGASFTAEDAATCPGT